MNNSAPVKDLTAISLDLDNGETMCFNGRPFAGGAWYDEETNTLTRQKLYITESGEHVYAITTARGGKKSKRAYKVRMQGEICTIFDGHTEMTIELEMLMLAVRALAGMQGSDVSSLEIIEETLRAANC